MVSLLAACGGKQSGSAKAETMCVSSDGYMGDFNSGKSLSDTCLTWPGADGKTTCGSSGCAGWSPKTQLCGPVIGRTATCDDYKVAFLSLEGHCVAVEASNLH